MSFSVDRLAWAVRPRPSTVPRDRATSQGLLALQVAHRGPAERNRQPEREQPEQQHRAHRDRARQARGGEPGGQRRLHPAQAAGGGQDGADGATGQVDHGDAGDRHLRAERGDAGRQAQDVGQAEQQRAADAESELARPLRDLEQPRQHLAERRRHPGAQRPARTASTASARTTRPASTNQAHRGGWMCASAELPAIAAKITISTMCKTNATTWATPTLAAAAAAGIFLRCRYLMFSAAPPTAAGVTRVMKEPATWTSRVRKKGSRPATKPDSEIVAPT